MNKSELVDAIADRSGVSKSDVDAALKGLFEVVAQTVSKGGDKITIPGFISFEQGHRAARTGRNPQTGESIQVAATNTVKISAGSKLKAIAAGRESAPA
jgi:DNA-binding protein HU-beta